MKIIKICEFCEIKEALYYSKIEDLYLCIDCFNDFFKLDNPNFEKIKSVT